MIYSSSSINETSYTNLRVDILISMIQKSLRTIISGNSSFQVSESVFSELTLLIDEFISPVGLSYFGKNNVNTNIKDEQIKAYLFSIISPEKLQILRNWISIDTDLKLQTNYKVEVLLHFCFDLEKYNNMYSEQLLNLKTKYVSCNLNLADTIYLVKRAIENLFNHQNKEYVLPEVIISILELIKIEIFYSNSTITYEHDHSQYDVLIKDFLFDGLTQEKRNALKLWLDEKNNVIIVNGRQMGLITSIYVPDWNIK